MSKPIEVFSVGTDFIQVVSRGASRRRLAIGSTSVECAGDVTVTTLEGLAPNTAYLLELTSPDHGPRTITTRTLERPSGRLLARIATVSDTHIGEIEFLWAPRLHSQTERRRFGEAHPVWALQSAANEIRTWAPDAVVIKGDLSHRDLRDEFALGISILETVGVPLIAVRGNHDGGNHQGCDTAAVADSLGLRFDRGVTSHRVGGARVVMVESTILGHSSGSVEQQRDHARMSIDPQVPTLMFVHHQFMRWPVPTYMPTGIPKREGDRFLQTVTQTSRRLLLSSGHTHRHRVRIFNGVPVTEVGSTKDYPGVWAGYEVYEGGIVQWVRRIADDRTLAWTESTRRAVFGTWGRWSPGRLQDRCFSYQW